MKIIYRSIPKLTPKFEAYDFQLQAVKSVRDLDYCAILHEQGLGKTKIAIDLLLYWIEKKVVDTVIIVVKKTLLHNWIQELKSHCFLRPAFLSQNKNQNFHILNGASRLILTNYEVIKSEFERMKLFLKTRDVAIILDESTKIKNPESRITKVFFELAPFFKRKVIMTGTPVANRPFDIWSQMWFLDQGKSLGVDYKSFRSRLDLSNDLSDSPKLQIEFEKSLNRIIEKIGSFTVRETKKSDVISLPKKVFERIQTKWEPIQYELYCQIRDEMRAIVVKEGLPHDDISENVLKRLLRLVQVASNPRLVDETYCLNPGKKEYLINLIQRITNLGEKCIVWTSFTDNVDWLNHELREFGTCKVHGRMDIFQRSRNIDLFKTDASKRALIATPGAAKEGLTLTVANHVIFYDRGFSLDDYIQAQDRIHRISQKSICNVYNLIMQNSIDEWVDLLLNAKELAAKLTQGDISLDYYRNQMKYDYSDMLKSVLNIDG